MTDLKLKTQELKSEKQSLITALTLLQGDHVLTDKDKRIQDLEDEKKNLLTALRVLQKDTVHTEQNNWKTQNAKQKVAPKIGTEPVSINTEPVTINTNNQYSILTVSDTEEGDISEQQHSTTSQTSKPCYSITQRKRQSEGVQKGSH